MNKKNIPFIIQLKQNNNYIVTGIEQNDAGVLFDIKIMDGLESFDFSGASIVTLKIQKPDGTFYVDSDQGDGVDVVDPENGRFKLNIPTSCTVQNGMHFCSVGFGYNETTLFATTSFNYFVGDNPHPDNKDVIGTDEFPILNNLIAEVSGAIAAENTRVMAENDRTTAENERATSYENMTETLTTYLASVQEALTNAQTMLNEVYEAIAQGGSIDISQITALATKTYVATQIGNIQYDFGDTDHTKSKALIIYHGDISDVSTLADGELFYDTDTHNLYVGDNGASKSLNDPCFIASALAPTDTSKLWIDISGTAPVIKYYNGSAWISCNTAVFG